MSKKTPRIYTPISTLRQLTLANMQKRAEKPLFKYLDDDGNVAEVSYGDFYYKCEKLIAALKKKNLSGKRVALIGETCPEWIETFCAVISAFQRKQIIMVASLDYLALFKNHNCVCVSYG